MKKLNWSFLDQKISWQESWQNNFQKASFQRQRNLSIVNAEAYVFKLQNWEMVNLHLAGREFKKREAIKDNWKVPTNVRILKHQVVYLKGRCWRKQVYHTWTYDGLVRKTRACGRASQ